MKTQKWSVCKEGNTFNIKRWVVLDNGEKKVERLKVSENREYQMLKRKHKAGEVGREEFEQLVTKLNWRQIKEEEARNNWNIRCAFLGNNTFEEFSAWIDEINDRPMYKIGHLGRINNHVFEFFLRQNNIVDYTQWRRNENQRKFVDWLVEKGLSVSTIDQCRDSANLFIKYLSELSDGQIDYRDFKLTFPSLTRKKKYKIETLRKRKMSKKDRVRNEGQYIPDEHFFMMIDGCDSYLIPLIHISYYYGLRLSECLAVVEKNYRKNYLLISEQAKNKTENTWLKGVEARKSPHFDLDLKTKKHTLTLIKTIKKNRVHPTTVTKDFGRLMKELNLNYKFHDLRGTWITNLSLQGIQPELIRQAAGHTDIRTTNRYLRDPHVDAEGDELFSA